MRKLKTLASLIVVVLSTSCTRCYDCYEEFEDNKGNKTYLHQEFCESKEVADRLANVVETTQNHNWKCTVK